MTIEEVEKRYVKGYNLSKGEEVAQMFNDMEWLMDKVLVLQDKYRNLLNAMKTAVEENNKR